MVVAGLDTRELNGQDRVLGSLLYVSFLVLCLFSILNILLAIIMVTYDEITNEVRASERARARERERETHSFYATIHRLKRALDPQPSILTLQALSTSNSTRLDSLRVLMSFLVLSRVCIRNVSNEMKGFLTP